MSENLKVKIMHQIFCQKNNVLHSTIWRGFTILKNISNETIKGKISINLLEDLKPNFKCPCKSFSYANDQQQPIKIHFFKIKSWPVRKFWLKHMFILKKQRRIWMPEAYPGLNQESKVGCTAKELRAKSC